MDLVSSPEHTKVVVLTDHVDKVSDPRRDFVDSPLGYLGC